MSQDVLDELLETEKAAAELVERAEKAAVRLARDTEEKIRQMQTDLKQELKQKRLDLKTELDAEYARAAAGARKKTEAGLEKLKPAKDALADTAEYLAQEILA